MCHTHQATNQGGRGTEKLPDPAFKQGHQKEAFPSVYTTPEENPETKTRIDVYETLCPQQMLVHKGGKIKNWGVECRDVTPTKSLSQNIRVDVNREVKFL